MEASWVEICTVKTELEHWLMFLFLFFFVSVEGSGVLMGLV